MALLRAVNVSGKNKLPMKDLASIFAEHGARDVRTYIQSGNVVFRAPRRAAERMRELVPLAIEARFGHRPPLVLRTSRELEDALGANPFLAEGCAEATLHVAFLDVAPTADALRAIDPNRSPGDRFALRGRDLYLHLPNGVGRSKLTNAYLERTLGATSTIRNWKTVQALAALCAGGG